MNETTGETGLEFPINQTLLDEATQTKEEWRVIRDRLAKIEEHKSQVSHAVYERVRNDYKARLKDATDAVLSKKADVDEELAKLNETRNKVVSDLEQHRHSLEEIKFRHTLGEYNEEEYQNQARVEQDKISKFETVLSAVNSNIHRYEAIYKDEPGLFAPQEHSAKEDMSSYTPSHHDAEPLTDEAGYVIEDGGPDYFGSTDSDHTNPTVEESATEKASSSEMRSGSSRKAGMQVRVVIINGDEAGAAYPLKGTISFGRAESNTVTIRDAKVSRQHAQIQQQGSEYVLIDLNSSNGTYVNGQRIEEHVLTAGDEIRIGDCIMQFQV